VDWRQVTDFQAKMGANEAAQAVTDERSLSPLQDRAAVIDVVLGFARALDVKDWAACRRCFADEIETDYSDLRGEPRPRARRVRVEDQ
jgi:hypothetical protein